MAAVSIGVELEVGNMVRLVVGDGSTDGEASGRLGDAWDDMDGDALVVAEKERIAVNVPVAVTETVTLALA